MQQYLVLCRSLTYAQRSAHMLERLGITATVTKAPKGMTTRGCAHCVKVSERNLDRALYELKSSGLGCDRTFRKEPSGEYSEVRDL